MSSFEETRIMEQQLRDLSRYIKASDLRRMKPLFASIKAINPDLINSPLDTRGFSAMHLAVEEAFEEGIELLLEAGEPHLDLNKPANDGETPLHVAVAKQYSVIVERLLELEKVEVNAKDKVRSEAALHTAARVGDLESLQLLLKAGANLAERDGEGNTALHLAVAGQKLDMTKELIKRGADPKLKNNQKKTPIYMAMKEINSPQLNQILIQQKSLQAERDRNNRHPASYRAEGPTRRPTKWNAPRPMRKGGVVPNRSNNPSVVLPGGLPKRGTFFTSAIATPNDPSPAFTPKPQLLDPNRLRVEMEQVVQRRAQLKSASCQVDLQINYPPVQPVRENPLLSTNTQRVRCDQHDPGSYYQMNSSPHGICLIINNVSYFHENFKDRTGADFDERRLETVFKKLGYIVKLQKNMSAAEIFWTVTNIAQKTDHTPYDSFICCILSHGSLGTIYDIHGDSFKISDLTVALTATRCKSLAGKPKMFFIQACRGDDVQNVYTNSDHDALSHCNEIAQLVPDHADFLLSYATVAGYRAQRNKSEGSIYLRHLCECLESDGSWSDVLSILVKVNGRVSDHILHAPDGMRYKQMPEVRHTLTRKIAFS